MKKELSLKTISTLKPSEKEYAVWDSKLPGLVLRVHPTGRMIYTLIYKRGARVTIGPANKLDPEQAREIAKKILAEHYSGQDPVSTRKRIEADNYLTFLEEVYKAWLESESGLRTWRDTYLNLKQCFPELHRLPLNEITPLVIKKWRKRRLEEIKPVSINRQMADLKACLNRAVEWGLLKEHPLKNVKPEKVDKSAKVRYLSTAEEKSLREKLDEREEAIRSGRNSGNQWREKRGYDMLDSLDKQTFVDALKPCVLLSLNTGMRRGELLKTKWEDVHFDQKNLTIPAGIAKGAKTRHIPLNDEALAILKAWKKQQKVTHITGYVFSDSAGQPFHDMDTSWNGVLRKAKIANFRWHDMRHSFASKLVMAGVDLNVVRELLGHSNYTMTLRYAHLAPKAKLDAVNKLVAAN